MSCRTRPVSKVLCSKIRAVFMLKIAEWILFLLSFVWQGKKKSVKSIQIISASLVGKFHSGNGQCNEDISSEVRVDGKSAFFVVDGAGGEVNGRLAALSVSCKLLEILKEMLPTWNDQQEMLDGLKQVLLIINQVAFEVCSRATMVLFVSLPDGTWAVLQVGDAIFLGKERSGKWTMPIHPTKYSLRGGNGRNNTNLLGAKDVNDVQPSYLSGSNAFSEFILSSDWVCGPTADSLIVDSQPNGIIGKYTVNQAQLKSILARLKVGKMLAGQFCLHHLLNEIQNGRTESAVSDDDMTLVYGVIS